MQLPELLYKLNLYINLLESLTLEQVALLGDLLIDWRQLHEIATQDQLYISE